MLALSDSLTGLPNRRAIEDWAFRQLSAASRHNFPLWVVMLDLDNFKCVNDTYGHEAGDIVLKRFADVLRTNMRTSNLCGRMGGEEFVIVITHTDRQGIETVIERIRHQFQAETFDFEGSSVKVTASFGVAGFEKGKTLEFSQLVRLADGALYAAKRAGRNRIAFAMEESDVGSVGQSNLKEQ